MYIVMKMKEKNVKCVQTFDWCVYILESLNKKRRVELPPKLRPNQNGSASRQLRSAGIPARWIQPSRSVLVPSLHLHNSNGIISFHQTCAMHLVKLHNFSGYI